MATRNSDSLFQLIKSLSKAEKRYFKLYVAGVKSAENAKFIQLFDVLDKLTEYDEIRIRNKVADIKSNQLSNIKAHLYKQILQSLRDYNPNEDIDIRIREHIDYATLLYNRSLYEQSQKMLEKAKKMAETYEKTPLMANILRFEKRLIMRVIHENAEERVASLITESDVVLERLHKANNFTNLSLKLYVFYTKIGYIRNHKDFELVNSFLYSTMPAFKLEDLTVDERISLHSSLTGFYFFTHDFERAYEYAKQWVALFNENPTYKLAKIEMYIRALNNLMMAQSKLGMYDEYTQALESFRTISDNKELKLTLNMQTILFKHTATHSLNMYFLEGCFTEGCQIIPGITAELVKFENKLNTHYLIILYYKFASMYFGNDDYKTSAKWLTRIINMKDVDLRADILGFARIMVLICHYEMGNTDMGEYYIRSTYRFLKKKEDMHQFQEIILRFLRKLASLTPTEYTHAFTDLKKQLQPLSRNRYERRAFLYFDIISWLESKIEQRPVQEIIREKSLQKRNSYR